MATKTSEVMSIIHKMSADMVNLNQRQDQSEARHEQAIQSQVSAIPVATGKRLERDKGINSSEGELYSPSDTPLRFGDLISPFPTSTSLNNSSNTQLNSLGNFHL